MNGVRFDVAQDRRPGTDYASFTNRHVVANRRTHSNKCALTDCYRSGQDDVKGEVRVTLHLRVVSDDAAPTDENVVADLGPTS